MSERTETARQLADLRDQYPNLAPVLHRAARLLLEGQPPAVGCRRCGGDVDQRPGRGRPRSFCPACSPRKKPKNEY